LQKNINIISDEMFQSIHDFEIEWKTTNLIWLTQQEVKKNKNKRSSVKRNDDDEEIKFQINSSQSSFLTENFISFEEDDDDDEIAKHTCWYTQCS
jgi:tRNA threonylcarbamoyladenosine modification (KEOPS) complex  Pcc1 subunit